VFGERTEGKITLVERDGREFELPDGHSIDLYAGRAGEATYVALNAPGVGGSIFSVRAVEERRGAVVVHLGDWMGSSGPAGFGDRVPEPTGYPFPEAD
jgi:hypothetical protein